MGIARLYADCVRNAGYMRNIGAMALRMHHAPEHSANGHGDDCERGQAGAGAPMGTGQMTVSVVRLVLVRQWARGR